MSLRPVACLRYHLRPCTSPLRSQRRWAQVHDIRQSLMARARHNSTTQEKYQDQLERKAKEEGFESVEQLKAAYFQRIKELKKKVSDELSKASNAEVEAQGAQPVPSQKPFHPPPVPVSEPQSHSSSPTAQATAAATSSAVSTSPTTKSNDSGHSNTPGIKPLSSYLDLTKVQALPATEVSYIWRLRHADDPLSLCATIPLETYNRIYSTARTHPRFILPLPRPTADDGSGDVAQSSAGFEGKVARTASDIHFLQWGFHPPAGAPPAPGAQTANTHTSTVLFTHLAAFKLHGEFSQPHTTVTHHLDLADSHGLVLLNGSVLEGRGVSVEEGKWLLMCLQKFYDYGGHGGGRGMETRKALVEKFSRGDASFSLDELVDEAERIS